MAITFFLVGLQLYLKKTLTQEFSYGIFEIFRNTYFEEDLRTTASVVCDYHTTKRYDEIICDALYDLVSFVQFKKREK